ncbi:Hpt domain-containing protein [Bremerella cremea]|uniref:Hpt domain-containing protein n=1 Tax=Bremerella cremea TaxID=1031537 RepID=A0A368KQ56_9BACT|nr:Hpt domain-containing protein [Bremerella cremea]RCS47790.1 Hpt domain-containing protein [Bremerella cremea]
MSFQSTHAPPSEQSLNWETLKARCIGRLDLVAKALSRFQGSLEEDIQQLEQATRRHDSNDVARIAHRIKGTSLTVSAERLAGIALNLERKAEENLDDVEASLVEIRDECCRLSEIILQHREEPNA